MTEVLRPGTETRAFLDALVTNWPHIEKRIRELPQEAQQAFKHAGLPPCNRLSLRDVDRIARTFSADGPTAATAMIEMMCKELFSNPDGRDQMLKDWESNPLLKSRIGILRDVLASCADCRYNVAIPTFLAQLEGTVADGVNHIGEDELRAVQITRAGALNPRRVARSPTGYVRPRYCLGKI